MNKRIGHLALVLIVGLATAIPWSEALAARASVQLPGSGGPFSASGPGCGLGYMLFKGQRGVVPQVLAATTNGTFGNQTFGMSTGTLGCSQDGIVSREHELKVYAEATIDNLAQEMAQGQGEHLASLAALIGVPADLQPVFFQLTQQQYAVLFPADDTSAADMLTALSSALAADPVLSTVIIRT
ncbi:MAG: DUF3015 domain-containing protein [Nitrospiria bacterium]